MIIKKRINNPNNYLENLINSNQEFYFGVPFEVYASCKELSNYGLPETIQMDLSVVPNPIRTTTKQNVYGKFNICNPVEYEIITRHDIPYKVTDWHGNEHTGTYSKSWKRKKRELVHNLHLPLIFPPKEENSKFIVTPILAYEQTGENLEKIKHSANMLLEIFGECLILDSAKMPIIKITDRVNWEMLPSGKLDKQLVADLLVPLVEKRGMSSEVKKNTLERLEFIESQGPTLRAFGRNAFNGYIAYGFPPNKFLLESILEGNATYLFDENWEILSKKDKQEILKNRLHKKRVFHRNRWKETIKAILN